MSSSQYTGDELFDEAMKYYDIQTISTNRQHTDNHTLSSIRIHNRLAAILLTFASRCGHIQAQGKPRIQPVNA